METTIRGSCVCGAIEFRIEAPFKRFQYCHCSRCRKNTGSAHAVNLFVAANQFAWENGESSVKQFELPAAKYWCSAFCTTCGSSLPWKTRDGKTMIVPGGALDEDPGVKPSRNIFFGSRAPWYVHASDLETHDTFPSMK